MLSFGGCWDIASYRGGGKYDNTPLELLLGTHSTCVQLFMSPGCTGESKTFDLVERPDDEPMGASISIFPQKWQLSRSISLCGVNCIGMSSLMEQNYFTYSRWQYVKPELFI